jgi:hypothetical protein
MLSKAANPKPVEEQADPNAKKKKITYRSKVVYR